MINQSFLAELEEEAKGTRRVLERLPAGKFDWKPHEKSMSLGRLATHIAEMYNWAVITLDHNELDFAKMDYKSPVFTATEDLVAFFETNLGNARTSIQNTDEAKMMEIWTMRQGEKVFMSLPRVVVLRSMVFNHIVHHRAQLTVYLRMLDIPLPGLYGPSADEGMQ